MNGSPEVLKLKNAGDGITLRINQCEKMSIGAYPEVSFIGVDADGRLCEVRVPQKSADRQLDRLDLTYAACVGATLTITRSANAQAPSKPFWDIVRADEPIDAPQRVAAKAAPVGTTGASAPATPTAEKAEKKGAALYLKITEFTLERVVKLYKDAGIPVTMEGVAACVATQYIAATRH